MIERIWHGWTDLENADKYERLLQEEIFPEIAGKDVDGYYGIRLLRRSRDDEVEFITIMRFESMNSVAEFAGDDYETAYVPSDAREVLTRFDDRAQHYEVREQREY